MTDAGEKDVISVATDIVDREMVISPQDTDAVQKFFDHFNLKMPEELKKSMKEFKDKPDLKTQKRFVIEVNRAISGEHSIEGLDEMFKPIVECAKETAYDLEFTDQVTEMLSEEPTPEESSSQQEPSDS